MTTTELHNMLLHYNLENGKHELRSDFKFEDLLGERAHCEYCNDGMTNVLAIIHPEVYANFCPMCGRELRHNV